MEQNWFGLEPHPTDDMIHWTERDPRRVAGQLREAYERIVAAGLLAECMLLIEAAQEYIQAEEAEMAAGESI